MWLLRRFLPDLLIVGIGTIGLLQLARWYPAGSGGKFLRVAAHLLLAAGAVGTILAWADQRAGHHLLLMRGIAFCLALALLGMWLVAALIRIASHNNRSQSGTKERRGFLRTATNFALLAAPPAAVGFGVFVGRCRFQLVEVEMPIPNLHADLDGLKLVQLSDIHLSAFLSRRELARCVDMANSTRSHLALVTGDLVTGTKDPLDDCLAELTRLRSDAGVFGCMGNHEIYVRGEAYVAAEGKRLGMNFLRQESVPLRFGAGRLNLAGVDFQSGVRRI